MNIQLGEVGYKYSPQTILSEVKMPNEVDIEKIVMALGNKSGEVQPNGRILKSHWNDLKPYVNEVFGEAMLFLFKIANNLLPEYLEQLVKF